MSQSRPACASTRPQGNAAKWLLDLGNVKESAAVTLNGQYVGSLIGPYFKIEVDNALLKDVNLLEVNVSNLMANRIADLDRREVFWKKFYNVNFPARMPENRKDGLFSAAQWLPAESGLIGPVTITSLSVF